MQQMMNRSRVELRLMFVGIVMLCTAIGCADSGPQAKKPGATTPAVAGTEAPKREDPMAKAPVDKAAEKAAAKDEVLAERNKLSPEDRKLVDAQEWCVISDDGRLGEMGPPIKLMIKGETVFICCKGCKKDAEANPEKTLAKLKELKAKKAATEKSEKKQGSS
jgi:hypothetical protein